MDNEIKKKRKGRGPEYDRVYLTNKVAMMRIEGMSTYNLLEFLMETIKCCRKVAYEILNDAQKIIVEIQKVEVETAFAEAIGKLEAIYQKADGKLKLETQKEINKLRGLYAAERIDVSITEFKAKFGESDDKNEE
jgi:nitrate reductase NapAB chaperone NapD